MKTKKIILFIVKDNPIDINSTVNIKLVLVKSRKKSRKK
jgi:hypothetical protein